MPTEMPDPDLTQTLTTFFEPTGTGPALRQPRSPWDMLIAIAVCDHCRQPVGLPGLITIGSPNNPMDRTRVAPPCLKVVRAEGLTDVYAL